MKFAALALTVVLLPACRTQPEKGPDPVREAHAAEQATSELDFSACQGRSMTVEEFVKVCQSLSGFNFTYTETTRKALGRTSLRLLGAGRIPARDFEGFLAAQLGGCGFTCEPVGPEHLHVFLVQPRAM